MPEEGSVPAGPSTPKLRLMVSSTVYGQQALLDQVFAMLEGYGYEVWMSHKGTIPTNPKRTAFSNCLDAVNRCNAFLGIITGTYGSGVGTNQKSITHREIIRAVSQKKLRWFLIHHDVLVARQLLRQFRFDDKGTKKVLVFKKTAVLEDIRVLEMYESAIRQNLPLAKRAGNWAQEYFSQSEAVRFIQTQFQGPVRIWRLLEE